MKLNLSTEKRSSQAASINAICIGASLLMPLAAYAGPSSPEPVAEEEEVATNWIEVEIGGASVDGNDAAYQRRFTSNGDFYGGIKSCGFVQFSDDGLFIIVGQARFGVEDF
jgi:hypothetical protein